MKVICIGSASKDIFFPTSEGVIIDTPEDLTSQKKFAFELGAKFQVEDRFESLGGCAANVAYGLAKLGLKVGCYSALGDDMLGKWITAELEKGKVDTDCLQIKKDCKSDLSAIIVDQKSGDRTIFFNRDANEKLEIYPEKIEKAEWFFVSALNGDWERNADIILETVARKSVRLAMNPGQKNIKSSVQKVIEIIKKSEVLMLNKDEALEIISGSGNNASRDELSDEIFLLKELRNLGPRVITLTDGIRGAWASEGEPVVYSKPVGANPKETTGAGDAFTSGFLAAVIKEKSLEEALKWGIVNSGNSVKFYGAISGLLTEGEIEKQIGEVKIEYL